jgi:hypothetical protein
LRKRVKETEEAERSEEATSEVQTEEEGGEETESAGDCDKPVGVDEAAGGEEQ